MELNMLKSALIENKVTIQINENPKFVQSINADPVRINKFDKIPRVVGFSAKGGNREMLLPIPPLVESPLVAIDCVTNKLNNPNNPNNPNNLNNLNNPITQIHKVATNGDSTKGGMGSSISIASRDERQTTPTKIIMQLIDPKFEILSSNDQDKEIFTFKEQMCKNLDNHMQFYKKLGFSRKKSITLDSLKKQIMNGDITPEIMLYFANLVQKNIVVITIPTLEREDYNAMQSTDPILLLKHEHSYELSEDGATEAKIKEVFINNNKEKEIIVKDMKITELRHLTKLFKIEKASTKVDMQNALDKIFTQA